MADARMANDYVAQSYRMKAKEAANAAATVLSRMSVTDRHELSMALDMPYEVIRNTRIRQIINRSVNQQVTVDKTMAGIGDIIDQLKAARA